MRSQKNKVCLVCHGPVTCNSGRHVLSIARELRLLGWDASICVPTLEGSDEDAVCDIEIQSFDSHISSLDSREEILYHYWTPREVIRDFHISICNRLSRKVRYIIHLEDDEMILFQDQMKLSKNGIYCKNTNIASLQVPPHLTHPLHGKKLIQKAQGITALTPNLIEDFSTLPQAVFWPGYDKLFEKIYDRQAIDSMRRELNIPEHNHIVTYIGNMHFSNVDEIRSLYIAVALVNRMGMPLTLIRTGGDSVPLAEHGADLLKENVIELGRVPKIRLPLLLQLADVLVQPGLNDRWNRMRVPSKLPEFLVSGRPVVLPEANLGTVLESEKNALVLEDGTASSIAETLIMSLPDKNLREKIGCNGRKFALEHLQWERAALSIGLLYNDILKNKKLHQ